jgi:cyanophycinase
MRTILAFCLAVAAGIWSSAARAAEPTPGGTLFVIGGGLRPDNAAVMRRMIDAAGGVERCRFAVFPTASIGTTSAERFVDVLRGYGIAEDRAVLVDVRPEFGARKATDPDVVNIINGSTAAYFTGGDQQRITRAFLKADGGDTPAAAALRRLLDRGGVIAGSSAGAAMQSETMIGVGGLPDEAIDEGMDALDFGLTESPLRRGLCVSRGLAFFDGGIIDQHFSQYRGRLGRLARAAIEKKIRYGFGIDENTAMVIRPGGDIEVVGSDCLTIVDAGEAKCADGPGGCRIDGLRITCLQAGDRFHPGDGGVTIHPGKKPVRPGTESFHGNHLITDVAAEGAVPYALFMGLAENTSRKLVGIALRYVHTFGHGYRLTFRKTERTQSCSGYVDNYYSYAIHDVDLSIEPILASFQSPDEAAPVDLPDGEAAAACRALWFRGILQADAARKLRPDEPITRAEFATALAQTVHLLPARGDWTPPADVTETEPWAGDVERVLAAELLALDAERRFRPAETISRREASEALQRAARFAGTTAPVASAADADVADRPLARVEAAAALYRLLRLPW